ncbi:uncharacterized protein LOC119996386 isoform X2 [Tripterygium wilfordii]|uniref:uncharacterized protein LOC119996386 isoform X2 n=1 Tax=Tripterygium wilfordii TaxID=458696 RepID=UPI0018F7EAA7|nr:uncharacterized protein LOC119996386 isoform X2 [Tripterygium wilfordii]XP_038698917.1 uncharacterized protein LOC119996386 isoform X2 [Tripterygium wilfordii]XP_038698918.1 uncharacterized protein LOC119996386 isoform X2 [Tripterygium wilfordii]XP_038698919.1 uncharacterized protein LOC119996386 isoform X2 [Tripterygium wilfordii]XP_038698920.1 uncharacterized protein LOC119996386 isoform X2 [Tripterygium wilfordii]
MLEPMLTSRFIKNEEREYGMVHVVSWMETLALRLLAVLANSTLSNSRDVASEQVPVQYGGLQFNMLDLTGKVSWNSQHPNILSNSHLRKKTILLGNSGWLVGM